LASKISVKRRRKKTLSGRSNNSQCERTYSCKFTCPLLAYANQNIWINVGVVWKHDKEKQINISCIYIRVYVKHDFPHSLINLNNMYIVPSVAFLWVLIDPITMISWKRRFYPTIATVRYFYLFIYFFVFTYTL